MIPADVSYRDIIMGEKDMAAGRRGTQLRNI
jgi:hypothetical protein